MTFINTMLVWKIPTFSSKHQLFTRKQVIIAVRASGEDDQFRRKSHALKLLSSFILSSTMSCRFHQGAAAAAIGARCPRKAEAELKAKAGAALRCRHVQ